MKRAAFPAELKPQFGRYPQPISNRIVSVGIDEHQPELPRLDELEVKQDPSPTYRGSLVTSALSSTIMVCTSLGKAQRSVLSAYVTSAAEAEVRGALNSGLTLLEQALDKEGDGTANHVILVLRYVFPAIKANERLYFGLVNHDTKKHLGK